MTGDKMKSDCAMDSRCRSEGRPSLPRRRVATKTSHENGDFEMELSLAIKESLKYAKEKEGQLKAVDKTSPLLNGVKTDESFSRMAGKMLSFATSSEQGQSSEVQQLKDLLLIHIELIQHQQEQLSNKDKDIRILRNEKDRLQCRLQKVEKRLVQLKQKEEALEARITANARSTVALARELTPVPEQAEKNRIVVKAEQPSGRKRKLPPPRKGQPKKPPKVKKVAMEADRTSESFTSEEEEEDDDDDAEESESGEEDEVDGDDRDDEEASDVEVAQEEKKRERDRKGRAGEESMEESKVKEEESKDPHPEAVLRTDCLYHVSCCVELPEDPPVEVSEDKEVTGEEVETPGWRINVLTNRYQLEGTENITDEAYEKRHQRHEVEERRRKRWDIQHMREQKVLEKLRGKEEENSGLGQTEQSCKTLLASIEDLTHVEISESVPIMAFGQAVPLVQPAEFELPWDTGPASSYTRKSHGGRGRQK